MSKPPERTVAPASPPDRRRALLFLVSILGVPPLLAAIVKSVSTAVVGVPLLTIHDSARAVGELSFRDRHDRQLTLKDFGSAYLLVNIWATWCPPCKREIPSLDSQRAAAKEIGGFDVVAISVDKRSMDQLAAVYGVYGIRNLDIYLGDEEKILRDLRIYGLPTTLLFDKDRREIGRLTGPTAWDSPALIAQLKGLTR